MNPNIPSLESLDIEMQRLLNIIIRHRCYGPNNILTDKHNRDWNKESRDHMCGAAFVARKCGYISEKDENFICNMIEDYLPITAGYLELALSWCRLPNSFPDRLKLYSDWANRPELIVVL